MGSTQTPAGRPELRAACAESRGPLIAVFLFSVFVNLLMLTGPLFMMQVYDRVIPSRSVPTLAALTLLVVFLFAMMAVLDHARLRLAARVGARVQDRLDRRVMAAGLTHPSGAAGPRDLTAVQRLLASPVVPAACDLPWTPLFFAMIFALNADLGLLALAGGAVLIVLALLNQRTTRAALVRASQAGAAAERLAAQFRAEAEVVGALGMTGAALDLWQGARRAALTAGLAGADLGGMFSTLSRSFRLLLQSLMLAAGAWLALHDRLSPGSMVAASILLGRGLAPIEATIAHWALVQAGGQAWRRLGQLLAESPAPRPRTTLPRPQAAVEVQQVTVAPPGSSVAALRRLSFALRPGQALGVVGPSGAGKTTLARALAGVWPPASGEIRLGGAALSQYDPAELGRHIGYLPQRAALFEGTIAQNIARMAPRPDGAQVVAAAKKAGAHEMILSLPQGYDTWVSAQGAPLSGGQVRRVALARAFHGDPVLLILDEPDANLDAAGAKALTGAIRQARASGAAVVVTAHRAAALEACDMVLVLDAGMGRRFGPLAAMTPEAVAAADVPAPAPARAGGLA